MGCCQVLPSVCAHSKRSRRWLAVNRGIFITAQSSSHTNTSSMPSILQEQSNFVLSDHFEQSTVFGEGGLGTCLASILQWQHVSLGSLRWRHNDHAGVSNHQPHGCLLNRLFRRKSKKTSKLRVTGLCVGNSPPGTGEFPAQMASYAENVSIWWRHHVRFKWRESILADKQYL